MDGNLLDNNFPLSGNGCMRIALGQNSFTHIILSSQGITFHWKEGREDAREVLANAIRAVGLQTVDGSFPRHDYFHFDAADAAFPNLHGHVVLENVDGLLAHWNNGFMKVFGILSILKEAGHLSLIEVNHIINGIRNYAD